jgi:hypothetical protein
MKVENVEALDRKLLKLLDEIPDVRDLSVVVGYTQKYAIYVHEDMEAEHPNGGQAKYLEQPMRQLVNSGELAKIITDAYQRSKDFAKSLLLGGMRILRDSQLLVPVDTSALKASGFVAYEKDLARATAEAKAKASQYRPEQ